MKQAVILSSHITGLAAARALGARGVPVTAVYYDPKDMGYVSRYVTRAVPAPHPVHEEGPFLDLLLDYGGKSGGGVLIPADDETLQTTSKHLELLRKYFIVACPDWNITELFLDKKNTYELAERIGVPVPRTLIPSSAREMRAFGERVGYPCLIKPCQSHRYFETFGRKMTKVENPWQMMVEYHRARKAGIDVMLQEYIPGKETNGANYNSYFWQGEALAEFTAQKIRYAPPEFGVPRVVVSRAIPEVVESGRKLLRAAGYHGFSCTEFKKDDRDGRYKLMEVNGRHNRSGSLAVQCGVNFPWIEYCHLVRGELAAGPPHRDGLYWIDELSDIISNLRYCREENHRLGDYLRPYRSRHVCAVFDSRDLKPFLKRCLNLAGLVIRGLKSPDPDRRRGRYRGSADRSDDRCESSTTG